MKISKLLSAALAAAALTLGTAAQAQDWRAWADLINAERDRRAAEAAIGTQIIGNSGTATGCANNATPYWSQETGAMRCPAIPGVTQHETIPSYGSRGAPPSHEYNPFGAYGAPQYIYNWGQYGLYQPPANHQWMLMNNGNYALVNILSGVIAAMQNR